MSSLASRAMRRPLLTTLLLGALCLPPLMADTVPIPTLAVLPVPASPDATVSTAKNAQFKTLQDAINAAPENATKPYVILIKPGKYRWQPTLIPKNKPFIHIIGEDSATTTLSYHLNVYETLTKPPFEGYVGMTLIVLADNFRAENLTIENIAGDRGQALALRIDGDRAVIRNCRILGWQDTIMVNTGRHYFKGCYIEGRVDFIYGSGTSVFDTCEIRSKNGGYVTAASTPADKAFGFVFLHCKLTGDDTPWEAGGRPHQADLGRPWRANAAVSFIECEMGGHISPQGWNNWSRAENEQTARFSEYKSTGPGANPKARAPWSRQLTDAEAKTYTTANILKGSDGWNPAP
jgi:pectinesterase